MDVIKGKYRHYKGNEYQVIGVGIHTETNEELVAYNNEKGELYFRPKEMFLEQIPRFKLISNFGIGGNTLVDNKAEYEVVSNSNINGEITNNKEETNNSIIEKESETNNDDIGDFKNVYEILDIIDTNSVIDVESLINRYKITLRVKRLLVDCESVIIFLYTHRDDLKQFKKGYELVLSNNQVYKAMNNFSSDY